LHFCSLSRFHGSSNPLPLSNSNVILAYRALPLLAREAPSHVDQPGRAQLSLIVINLRKQVWRRRTRTGRSSFRDPNAFPGYCSRSLQKVPTDRKATSFWFCFPLLSEAGHTRSQPMKKGSVAAGFVCCPSSREPGRSTDPTTRKRGKKRSVGRMAGQEDPPPLSRETLFRPYPHALPVQVQVKLDGLLPVPVRPRVSREVNDHGWRDQVTRESGIGSVVIKINHMSLKEEEPRNKDKEPR
jgi:hypothetical protein